MISHALLVSSHLVWLNLLNQPAFPTLPYLILDSSPVSRESLGSKVLSIRDSTAGGVDGVVSYGTHSSGRVDASSHLQDALNVEEFVAPMARKRKHPYTHTDTTSNRPTKKPRPANHVLWPGNKGLTRGSPNIRHTVLSSLYPRVCTLRSYLLASLPASSRVRRRKLTSFERDEATCLLDTCLVGILREPSIALQESRKVDFATFTQSQQRATGACTDRAQPCCMKEVGHTLHRPNCVKHRIMAN